MTMKILIVGRAGREHALAWKAALPKKVSQVFVAPGNAGTALEPKVKNIAIDELDIPALIHFAKTEDIDLTIIGPEAPLAAGIVDAFQTANLPCFGPTKAAARLESSKSFSKAFMQRHQIPTAAYQEFTDLKTAQDFINQQTHFPIVIKADGLAAGKGVIIANTQLEAIMAINHLFLGLGNSECKIIIEDFLTGEEASFIVLCDGEHILTLSSSQDHKTRDEGDTGPNTGGMGAYSPAPVVTPAVEARILQEIIYPTLQGMASEGNPYVGFLYAGVMIDEDQNPWVLEFNCRLGDPETQPLMLRLRSDLIELCQAALSQSLHKTTIDWDPRPALGVVLASGGYPDEYQSGYPILGLPQSGLELPPQSAPSVHLPLPGGKGIDTKIFHAGTLKKNGQVVTSGGRVLCVTALGEDILDAQTKAYSLVKKINWDLLFGRKATKRIIEIGFGMGQSLLAMAMAAPSQDFIGIEVYRSGVGSLLADLEAQHITNVRVFCMDAVVVLEQAISDASVDRVQLFFPDPWPKKRHHKRRLIQSAFVEKVAKKLRTGGVLHIATDWEDYAHHSLEVLSQSPSFINLVDLPSKFIKRPDYRPLTKYEKRGKNLGHGVWDLIFVKR